MSRVRNDLLESLEDLVKSFYLTDFVPELERLNSGVWSASDLRLLQPHHLMITKW